jgi:hypothetical protein
MWANFVICTCYSASPDPGIARGRVPSQCYDLGRPRRSLRICGASREVLLQQITDQSAAPPARLFARESEQRAGGVANENRDIVIDDAAALTRAAVGDVIQVHARTGHHVPDRRDISITDLAKDQVGPVHHQRRRNGDDIARTVRR